MLEDSFDYILFDKGVLAFLHFLSDLDADFKVHVPFLSLLILLILYLLNMTIKYLDEFLVFKLRMALLINKQSFIIVTEVNHIVKVRSD